MFLFSGEALTGLEATRSVSALIRLGPFFLLILRRGAHRVGGDKIRLGDDPSWTLIYSFSQERRSPGWRLEDPSWRFLAPRRGAHRAGGNKIRLGNDPSRTMIFSNSQERRSRAGGWKIRLGDFLLPKKGAHRLEAIRSVSAMIRLGP